MKSELIDWIDERLAISGAIDDYNKLTKEKIDTVINVMAEQHDNIIELTKRGISYFWIPVVDFMCPNSHQIRAFKRILMKGTHNRILLHCELGMGRSAFFAIVYLIDECDLSLESAIEKLKEIRPEVSLTPPQMDKLEKIYGGK